MKSEEIREGFLRFFEERGHQRVASSPLIPADDPSLLFTNAGMVQFKRVFLGEEKRPYSRATTCQKCVRAGGKHNDLENVGYTARHHTFFEMLGNFSFGDYFKEEAIQFAWEFVTEVLGLPKERLWVTVFEEDDEAARLWQEKAGVDPSRIVRLGEKDNFWAMGDTGPCGPCSEILIDQGEEMACGPACRVGCDCDRFLELWNLVFMQFFRDEEGRLNPLPRPSIDTGMGLERVAAVLQGKRTNFDSDLFEPIIGAIATLAGRPYGQGGRSDVAMRVIADHVRSSAFLIADGVIPSNEGRGFVLRRVIRRAARYGRVLGLEEPFMAQVAQAVIEKFSPIYPELSASNEVIAKVLSNEEQRFSETLGQGLAMLEEEIARIKAQGGDTIPGSYGFKLYDTYGFPVDILIDMAKEAGLRFDRKGFDQEMEKQRARSRTAAGRVVTQELPACYKALLDSGQATRFLGYETLSAESQVAALFDGHERERVEAGWKGELVTLKAPFYGESGGQVGDRGVIRGPQGRAEVMDTKKRGDLTIHLVEVVEGAISVGDRVAMEVTEGRRSATARNHTATHLLHAALRRVLGEHVRQAGSLVEPERLRFDFTHFQAVAPHELRQVEELVNRWIRANTPVCVEELSYDEAVKRGAMALFGEKYGDRVRVISVGDWSRELCGGTHVARSGDIGLFKVVSESSVASGVRRIEAVTGEAALELVHRMEDRLAAVAGLLKCRPHEVEQRIQKLQAQVKELEKRIRELSIKGGAQDLDAAVAQAPEVNGVKVVALELQGLDMKGLREAGDRVRDRLGSGVAVLASALDGKVSLVALVTKDLTGRLHAGKIVGEVAKMVGGGGGGRPDMAQAGGKRPEKVGEALEKVAEIVRSHLEG